MTADQYDVGTFRQTHAAAECGVPSTAAPVNSMGPPVNSMGSSEDESEFTVLSRQLRTQVTRSQVQTGPRDATLSTAN